MKIVHSKLSYVSCFPMFNVLPGMNNISDPIFDQLNQTIAFKEMVQCQKFIIGGSYNTETSTAIDAKDMRSQAQKTAEEIKSLIKKDELTEVISQCTDPYVLKHLKQIDGRKATQDLVEARLKAIDTQENTDLRPESKQVSDNGADFSEKLPTSQEALEGNIAITSIPALNRKKQ